MVSKPWPKTLWNISQHVSQLDFRVAHESATRRDDSQLQTATRVSKLQLDLMYLSGNNGIEAAVTAAEPAVK